MTHLIIERGVRAGDQAGDARPPSAGTPENQRHDVEVRSYARAWTDPLDWAELARGAPGVAHVVTHACGRRAGDGAWLDGPIVVFARDGSVVGAIPSGGAARLEIPLSALAGPGLPVAAAIELERDAPWRCLRALVADACTGVEGVLRFAGGEQDLRAALALFAARQAFPSRTLTWLSQGEESQAWRRFLHNAGVAVSRDGADPALPLAPLAAQISQNVLRTCLAGAQAHGNVIPKALTRAVTSQSPETGRHEPLQDRTERG